MNISASNNQPSPRRTVKLLTLVLKSLMNERAQVLPWVAVLMVAMLGMTALVVDIGHAFYSYRELQASTDAAALAGAQGLPSGTAAVAQANLYSGISGGKNTYNNLPKFTMPSGYPMLKCLSTLTAQGVACVAPGNANAIQVRQQVSVPTFFARIFGVSSIPMTATATAAMRGAISSPYNVAIIVDATGSMSTTDTNCTNQSRFNCALSGMRVLLQALVPCGASQSSCGTATNGNVANSVDRVSLFAFPNMTTTTASTAYDCSSSAPTTYPYTFPSATATSLATMPYKSGSTTYQMTYQVLNFSSDYRNSSTASSLNTGSNLTVASNGKSGCTGMTNPGGQGTYYAGVLYAAQAALLAEQTANPGSENVIVMLSDGDATASQSQMATGTTSTTVATSGGSYPSWVNMCGQAVTAAKAIAATGTIIYSVAYGSASSGCASDTSGTYKGITPCQTMEYIASSASNFFSDYNQSGSGSTCQSASQPTTNLNQIFTQIAGSLTLARLVPDNTP